MVTCCEGDSHLHADTSMTGLGWACDFTFTCFCDKYGCQFPPALTQPAHQQLVSHSRVIQTMRFAPSVRLSGSGAVRPIRGLVSGPKLVANNHTCFTACSQQGSKKKPVRLPAEKQSCMGTRDRTVGPVSPYREGTKQPEENGSAKDV